MTGNPVRQSLLAPIDRNEALKYFGLENNNNPIVLVIGGSLGARSINNGIRTTLSQLPSNVQLIWQTGKIYFDEIKAELEQNPHSNVRAFDFIKRMDYAFGIADLVISRAGASSISELALLGKPSILVPSPNVSEDHQTKNAQQLVNAEAAIMVRNADTEKELVPALFKLAQDKALQEKMSTNIGKFARPNAADDIVDQIVKAINTI